MRRSAFLGGTLCLLFGSTLFSASTAAQGSAPASSTGSVEAEKDFAFEVISIRPRRPDSPPPDTQLLPNGYRAGFTASTAILQAYNPGSNWIATQIVHGPAWMDTDWYEVDARVADADAAAWQQAQGAPGTFSSPLLRTAVRAMLKERFHLALHITAVEVPYLNIVAGEHGAKLKDTVPGAIKPAPGKTSRLGEGFYIDDDGKRQFVGVTMDELARAVMRLSQQLPVQDNTGIPGRHDFTVPWYGYAQVPPAELSSPLDRMPLTSIGLALKPGKGPGYLIDIEHIDRPDAN